MESKEECLIQSLEVEASDMSIFAEVRWERKYWDTRATVSIYITLPDGTKLRLVTSSDYSSLDRMASDLEAEINGQIEYAFFHTWYRLRKIHEMIRSGDREGLLPYTVS